MLSVCHSRSLLVSLLATVLLCLGFNVPAEAVDPFGFSTSWNYRENGGDVGASSQFSESYNLTYSKELSAAMMFAGAVRYSANHPSAGRDSSSLNPTLSLDLRNDLFSLNLNASESQTTQDGNPTRTDDSWGFNLNSQIENWPSLRLYFNQTTATDDSKPAQTDNDLTTVGASIDYSFKQFDLLYDVRATQGSDSVDNSEYDSLDQTAQISYAEDFYQGRVAVSASQQYQRSENNSESRVGAGNPFFVEVTTFEGLFAVDNTPLTGSLVSKTDLVDRDLNSSTGIDLFSTTDSQNLGVWVNQQTVTRLQVIMVDDQLSTTLSGLQPFITWKVFSSPVNNATSNWTPVPDKGVLYTEENGRTVVVIDFVSSVTRPYLKVVSDVALTAATPLFVSELQAREARIASADIVKLSRETRSMQTQFSTSVRITDAWSLSYSLRRAETQQDVGDSLQFSHSLSSSYELNEKVGFVIGVSENRDEADNSPDRRNRSYFASMSARPLPTLNVSLGYTRTETESDDGQDSLSDSLSSVLNVSIYPDLTASLAANWSQSEELDTGVESNSYGLSLNTTAYFTPRVDMNTNLSYTKSESSAGESDPTTSYGFTLGYRPSDMLLLNFAYDGVVEDGSSSFSGNSSWLWSKKLQSQFGFSFDFGDETSQQYNALLSWLISRNLSLQTSGNYQMAEVGDGWNFNSSLNMIF